MSVENTLAERGSRYGSFIKHAEIAQGLQAVIQKAPNWAVLDYDMRQALVTITDKIARILNGDPYYGDNWHDIQGYAKLVEDRIMVLPDNKQDLFENLGAPRPVDINKVVDHNADPVEEVNSVEIGPCTEAPSNGEEKITESLTLPRQ